MGVRHSKCVHKKAATACGSYEYTRALFLITLLRCVVLMFVFELVGAPRRCGGATEPLGIKVIELN